MADTDSLNILWKDRKRILGMPISFTRYSFSDDRVFVQTGLFSSHFEEILLYRIRDISLNRTLWQKIFRVGTLTVISSDKTAPTLVMKNIKNSFKTKELLHEKIEEAKIKRRVRIGEVMGLDGDGDIDDDDIE